MSGSPDPPTPPTPTPRSSPKTRRAFLTARWANLIIASYHAPEELLRPYLPEGLELDLIDGAPTVSLVAFEFLDTRVMGVPWPGFVNFPEWNLRFYVRTRGGAGNAGERGVVFVREFVPSRLISAIARGVYNEPYTAARFSHRICREAGSVSAMYAMRFGGRTHTLRATAMDELAVPDEGTVAHQIKEQTWGFGRDRGGRTLRYRVDHPRWRVFANAACDVDVDWGVLYGEQWAGMQGASPFSVVLVEGSGVEVFGAAKVVSQQ